MEQKYKRKDNWTKEEISALVQAVAEQHDILTGKLSPSLTAERKARAWESVVTRVNAVSVCDRNRAEIKKKWQTYQSGVKAKESRRLREANGTGGGPRPSELSETEMAALCVIPQSMVSGIAGGMESGHKENHTSSSQPECSSCEGNLNSAGDDFDFEPHCTTVENMNSQGAAMMKKCPRVKKRSATVAQLDQNEDYRMELLNIEKRKLQIEEERLKVQKEQCEAIKNISLLLQTRQFEYLLQSSPKF